MLPESYETAGRDARLGFDQKGVDCKGTRVLSPFITTKTLTTPIVVPEAVRREAGLQPGEQIEFKTRDAHDYPLKTVTRIIKSAKRHPMSREQGEALDAELMAYGAQRAKKAGVKERDIPRTIHESRARRRTP
jgi:bifunctional DNA-binding transcriptional regulator/antitoxin component of YhaV-PrlF toxin-antitoxin module